jgi:hypothetical protein
MIELTAEMIIEIHDTIIQRYGGLPGILCQGTISSRESMMNLIVDRCAAKIFVPKVT